jgi:hypothetical protein
MRRTSVRCGAWDAPPGEVAWAATKVAVRHGGCSTHARPLDFADPPHAWAAGVGRLGFFSGKDRVAVVVTTDGRRVTVPLRDLDSNVSLLDLIRSLLAGLDGLLGLLITGSRRENGGTRRDGRH